MDRPVNCQQLDLLVCASGALEQSRVWQEVRGEVTLLLKLLMAECIAVGATQAVEAVDE
jgi:hypothetical protein